MMGFNSITESGFLAAYALLLGANNFQIGVLAALPFWVQPTQILMTVWQPSQNAKPIWKRY